MYKILLSIVITTTISGCSAIIKEDKFIYQEDLVAPYLEVDLQSWQSKYPAQKLIPLSLKTKDKSAILNGLFLDNPDSEDVIFFIQGNGMTVSNSIDKSFERLTSLGKDIVYFDRRGSGASNGKATINNLSSDALEQISYINDNIKPSSIIVHGYSLGSFVAGHIAKFSSIDALVLEGSATNVTEWIDKKVPWYTKPFLTVEIDEAFHTVDNTKVLSEYYSGPLLIIGAENDEQVPVELSQKLFKASKSKNKKLLIVEGADHSAMLDNEEELNIYKSFLSSI